MFGGVLFRGHRCLSFFDEWSHSNPDNLSGTLIIMICDTCNTLLLPHPPTQIRILYLMPSVLYFDMSYFMICSMRYSCVCVCRLSHHSLIWHTLTNSHKPLKYLILVTDGEEEAEDGEGNTVDLNDIKLMLAGNVTLFFLDIVSLDGKRDSLR